MKTNQKQKNNWGMKKLGEVCDIQSGRNQKNVIDLNGKFPIYGSAGKIMGFANAFLCKEGTTIIGRKGTIDKPLYIKTKFWNVDTAFGLVAGKKLDKKFLFYFCESFDFKNLDKGTTLPSLIKKDLLKIKIPLPPLSEQKRIVGILDEVFEKIEKAKGNTEKNLKNTKQLFESYLQSVFDDNEEWEEKELNELGILQTGTTPKTFKKENVGNFIPFIKPADFNKNGSINYDNFGLSEIGSKKSRVILKSSVLMVCIGATIGKTGFTEKTITCNQQINSLTLDSDYYPKLFYYAMITNKFQNSVIENSGQMTLPIINKTKWSKLKISYPKSLSTQKQIVSKLDKLSKHTKMMEKFHLKNLENLAELKKSLLKKAFNGEL